MKLLIFFALFSFVSGQRLTGLNTFFGGNFKNELKVSAPYAVYLSAYTDSQDTLSNIYLVTEDGVQISLNQLRTRKLSPDSGELQRYSIYTSAYITTGLTTAELQKLNGVLFLSTASQLKNNNFRVIDVNIAQTVGLQGLGSLDSTLLFLNTHMDVNPIRSSVISEWSQDNTSWVYIYPGLPSDTVEPQMTQIFSNPLHMQGFFSNVETFTLMMTSFYMQTYKGGPTFRIEPKGYSIDGTTTTAYTTTGLYMKQSGEIDRSTTVHTLQNRNFNGSCGANIVGALAADGKVKIGEYNGALKNEELVVPKNVITTWNAPVVGERIVMSSENGADGQYYVQYYVWQGENPQTTVIPGTQTTAEPGTTTLPRHVETTTTTSGNLKFWISMIFFIGFFCE